MRVRIIGFFVLCMVVAGGFFALNELVLSYTKVTLSNKLSTGATVYRSSPGEEGSVNFDKDAPLGSIPPNSNTVLKLKKGRAYVAVLDNSTDFQNKLTTFNTISDSSQVLVTSDLSQKKLDSLVGGEMAGVNYGLDRQLAGWQDNYSLTTVKLYGHGDWAGAVLTPKDQQKFDTLRTILQKKEGKWVVLVAPPKIVITKVAFPNIPAQYINDIDNFSQ